MEIKDFIILWTYSQWRQALVVIPPFLSRTGNLRAPAPINSNSFFEIAFFPRCLYLHQKMYIYYFMLYLAESLTGRNYTEGKLLRYFPLWREGKGRKLCLLSANSYGIWEGVKQNVFFLQSVRIQKLINESMRNVFLSGERGGPSKMVESRFLFVGIRESKRMLHMAFL